MASGSGSGSGSSTNTQRTFRLTRLYAHIQIPPSQFLPSSHCCSSEVELGGMHAHVLEFLLSLEEPLPTLMPLLCKLGVRDAESLLTLAKFHDRDKWLWQVAALCGVGHLQTQILLNGLQGLVAMP